MEAIVTLHNKYSDRVKRAKSRIKFLVDRFGPEGFIEKYREELARIKQALANQPYPKGEWKTGGEGEICGQGAPRHVVPQKQPGLFVLPVSTPIGNLNAKQLHGLARFAEFTELLSVLVRSTDYRLLSTVQLQSFEDDASLARISTIVDFISEHYAEGFSMVDLCERVGMTESSFSRYFRRATGNSFTDFVNRLRINKACQLLMETERYITNVCYDVGFNNVANFNRRFRELKGMTPKEFRRQADARFGAAA